MAHIVILPANFGVSGTDLHITGICRVSPDSEEIPWDATVAWSALAATVNQAMVDAAIAAAEAENYTIGALDKKTLLAGAVGL